MLRPQVGSSEPTLRKSQRPYGGSRTDWRADYWRGKCPAQGWWWWGDSQKSYIPSQPYKIGKNGEKRAVSRTFWPINHRKCRFFALKYLTRYTHETFFEEYVNFKIFRNLSHCGVIPVRSFGSHIRPQPHGLGLKDLPNFPIRKQQQNSACLIRLANNKVEFFVK